MVSEDRLDRSLETREEGQRARTWQRPSLLPTPEPKDGYGYRWVRLATLGDEDVPNMTSKLREGWEPVTYREVPEIATIERSQKSNARVEIGGLVLCRMPIEMLRQRDEYYTKQALSAVDAVENSYFNEGGDNPRMKKIVERRSETKSFG